MKDSILGVIDVYNLLPQDVVEKTTVKDFQHRLQDMLREESQLAMGKWENLFSPRNDVWNKRLRDRSCCSVGGVWEMANPMVDNAIATTCINGWMSFKDNFRVDTEEKSVFHFIDALY